MSGLCAKRRISLSPSDRDVRVPRIEAACKPTTQTPRVHSILQWPQHSTSVDR